MALTMVSRRQLTRFIQNGAPKVPTKYPAKQTEPIMPVVWASNLNESAKLPNMTGSTLKGKPPMVDAKLADKMKANKSRLEGLVVIGNQMFGVGKSNELIRHGYM